MSLNWVLLFLYENEKVPLILSCTSLWIEYFHELLEIKDCFRRLQAHQADLDYESDLLSNTPLAPCLDSNSSVSS